MLLLPLIIAAAAVFWYMLFSGQLGDALREREQQRRHEAGGGQNPGGGRGDDDGGDRGGGDGDGDGSGEGESGDDGEGNDLGASTSPYLLQHADNPVAWKPWGKAAFEKARREDKPIFLSVGYSTCHWCHVMAHESFEDEAVAAALNADFVPVKVDREQLPDVDAHYMLATQAFFMLAGQARGGGWPNSVWLMPDGRPFYAGTYFPKPRFMALLERLGEIWRNERDTLEKNAVALTQAIESMSAVRGAEGERLSSAMLEAAVAGVARAYDEENAGFGGAPKFPPHGLLELIERRLDRGGEGADALKRMFLATLDAMQGGGVYDQVGGGFHRYATDRRWFLPHFEKMLYDNAQLLGRYAAGYRMTGDGRYRRTVAETVGWLERRMLHRRGGFYSAMDADSEGEEGRYYVWSMDELRDRLGEADAALFAEVFGMTEGGNWTDEATGERPGTNIAYLPRPIERFAETHGEEVDALRGRLDAMRAKLLEARRERVPPHTDDKILAAWNGLLIEGLAEAGATFEVPRYLELARGAAGFVLDALSDGRGGLMRSWRDGQAEGEGYLDDYAFMAGGLLALHEQTDEPRWLDAARSLVDRMIERFGDARRGGFFYTASDHDTGGPALLRSKSPHAGGNTPSPNGRAARVLFTLGRRTNESAYAAEALRTLQLFAGQMGQYPHGSEDLLIALNTLLGDERAAALAGFDAAAAEAETIARQGPIAVEATMPAGPVEPGRTVDVTLRLRVDEPYHIYGPEPGNANLTPTQVMLDEGADVALGKVRYPEPTKRHDPVFDQTLRVYEGAVELVAPVTVERASEGVARFALTIMAQACDDRSCLAPVTLGVEGQLEVSGVS